MKEQKNRFLNHSRSYNKLEGTPKYDTLLSSFFSKQFLGNVKQELTKKTQSTRYLQINSKNDQDKHSQKNQLYQMEKKIKDLSKQNEELKRTNKNLTSMPHQIIETSREDTMNSVDSLKRRQLCLNSGIVSVEMRGEKADSRLKEIEKLQEKIEQLLIHKSIKEQRLNEMLEKEVRYEGEIKLLKLKEITLENEVKSLKESIKIQMSDFNIKPLKNTNISQVNMILPESGSSQSQSNMPFTPQQLIKISDFLLNIRKSEKSNSLLTSNCEVFEVPDHLHLSKLYLKKSLKQQPINEIDELIQEQLPFIQSADLEDILGRKNGYHKGLKTEENAQIAEISQEQREIIEGTCQSIINIDVPENINVLKSSQQSLVKIDF